MSDQPHNQAPTPVPGPGSPVVPVGRSASAASQTKRLSLSETRQAHAAAEFGELLSARRTARRMTYRDVAAESGVSASTVLRAERGEIDPTFLKLLAWVRDDDLDPDRWRRRALEAERAMGDLVRTLVGYDAQLIRERLALVEPRQPKEEARV